MNLITNAVIPVKRDAPNIKLPLSFSPFSFKRRPITAGIETKKGLPNNVNTIPSQAIILIFLTVRISFSSFFSVVT